MSQPIKQDLPPSFSRGRRWSMLLHLALALVALAGLVTMLNYLSSRHFFRWSLGSHDKSLSPLTLNVLRQLTNTVKVYFYFDSSDPVYSMTDALLKDMARESPHLELRAVDNLLNPTAASRLRDEYQLSEKNVVVFDYQGRRAKVSSKELGIVETIAIAPNQYSPELVAYRGEQVITSALISVIEDKKLSAYFLSGHMEHRPDDPDKDRSYSKFAEIIQDHHASLARLSLHNTNEIPADCDLLVIAGAKKAISAEELDKIERYLENGGRAWIGFETTTPPVTNGLERLLLKWDIVVGDNVLLDENGPNKPMVAQYFGTNHPVSAPLRGGSLYLHLPRSIQAAIHQKPGADAPRVEPLVGTSPAGRLVMKRGPIGPLPDPSDPRGQFTLAVAAEKGSIKGLASGRGATRLVVVGESLFINDSWIDFASNADFARLSVSWLFDRTELLKGIGPKRVQEYRMSLSPRQNRNVRWVLIGLIPAVPLLLGLLGSWLRRN